MKRYRRFLALLACAFSSSVGQAEVSTSFAPGWNLGGIGSHAILNVADAGVFGNPANVISAWKWLPEYKTWAFYSPQMTSIELADYALDRNYAVLATIFGSDGFWVNAKQAFSVTVPDGPVVAAATFVSLLLTGWNLIATGEILRPSEFNKALSMEDPTNLFDPVNVNSLWAWDNSQSKWYFFSPVLKNSGELAPYILGKGYLDFTASNKKLGPGVGFWANVPTDPSNTTIGTTTTTTHDHAHLYH